MLKLLLPSLSTARRVGATDLIDTDFFLLNNLKSPHNPNVPWMLLVLFAERLASLLAALAVSEDWLSVSSSPAVRALSTHAHQQLDTDAASARRGVREGLWKGLPSMVLNRRTTS
jgi:hypothetical protein